MRTLFYHSGFEAPVLNWKRAQDAEFRVAAMRDGGPGRNSKERCWQAVLDAADGDVVQFFITDKAGRDPQNRFYEMHTSSAFLQDGQIFTYRPAAQVDGPRRGYDPARPPSVYSQQLGEHRTFRVYLPRGYRQHTSRRYPVVYIQDGQNIFESGNFGSWNAQRAFDRLMARGQMQEVIVVAVDHGSQRFQDYVPNEDGGRAAQYARFLTLELKPWVDRNYRTRTGPEDTCIVGSSLGGVTALYVAWDFFHVFGKAAVLSGSWWLKNFQNRMAGQRKRPIRCYVDSGASGPYNDGVHHFVQLRDKLEQLGFGGDELKTHIQADHQHTESAWGMRLPNALKFLLPAQCEEEKLPLRRAA